MPFRTLEITEPAEIHIKNGQLEITQDAGVCFVPIEDLYQINTIGPNIRLSTNDLTILTSNKVSVMTMDNKYLPAAIVLPYEGHSRQSQMLRSQIDMTDKQQGEIWKKIIKTKIENQAKALTLMGKDGCKEILEFVRKINAENVDYNEALAAKAYFQYFHKGLNRRNDDPVNSRLNYGYAVVRGQIARCLVSIGFNPALGIHHKNQLNSFNLADDLVEPYRAMVDLVANRNIGPNERLNKIERRELAAVLHNACVIDGIEMSVISSIDVMCESLKRIYLERSNEELKLPEILPIKYLGEVME